MNEYIVKGIENISEVQMQYPDLLFASIIPGIYIVGVPDGSEVSFEQLEEQVRIVSIPTLYGLNAEEGLIDANVLFFHDYPFTELRGRGILVGFIDTGIDYTNKVFQYEDNTTRIISIWDQTIEGNPPQGLFNGTVYTEEQINEALKSEDPLSIVPSVDEIGHGTYLAGITAGYDRSPQETFKGGAPDSEIIMVKLKPASETLRQYYLIDEGAPAYEDSDILQGLRFLLDVANREQKPIAICLGVGGNNGAHNGSTVVERVLETLALSNNVVISVAAGNEANQGHHYQGVIRENEVQGVEFNIAPRERGLVIQLWANPADQLAVSVSSPLGYEVPKTPTLGGSIINYNFPLEKTKIQIRYRKTEFNAGAQNIEIRLEAPTPGLWGIKVVGEYVVDGNYHIWLPRKDFIKEDTRFSKAEAFTTVNIPATSQSIIVVGAYSSDDKSIYAGSGRGPTVEQVIKPDLIAPGVNVSGPSARGGFNTYTGTSPATAITTAACALLLQWAIVEGNLEIMNTRIAKTILIRGAARRADGTYPNNIEGYGRLDLRKSLSLM